VTAESLLRDMECRDIRLRVEGDRLRYTAPPGALTDADRDAIQQHRAELVQLVAWGRLSVVALMEAAADADTQPPGLADELRRRQRGVTLMLAYEAGGEAAVVALARPTLEADVATLFDEAEEVDEHEMALSPWQ
jgi:hypothetical protein